jgi:hypothetical protein
MRPPWIHPKTFRRDIRACFLGARLRVSLVPDADNGSFLKTGV